MNNYFVASLALTTASPCMPFSVVCTRRTELSECILCTSCMPK